MKFLPLLALAAVTALTGCQTQYTKFTASDLEGRPIVEWIAEGSKRKTDQGYQIKAVERSTFGVDPVHTRYPNGWRTIVTGPTIIFEPTSKPLWLAEIDGEVVVEETTTTSERHAPMK
jgi:hypothetical protein